MNDTKRKTATGQCVKEAPGVHVGFSIKSSAGMMICDVWKWASIIGSQTPWGNNERIYRPWHFSCPWTCYLQIFMSITRWNTTWLEVLMIATHTGQPHISPPLKSRKYLKETQVEACPALHHSVCSSALKTQRPFFVYKPLIMLMTLRSHIGYFSIDHSNRDQNKVTTLRICACARLKEMKEMQDSTFKLLFIREDNKGSQCHYPPWQPAVCVWTSCT